jgi:hypothetical protein
MIEGFHYRQQRTSLYLSHSSGSSRSAGLGSIPGDLISVFSPSFVGSSLPIIVPSLVGTQLPLALQIRDSPAQVAPLSPPRTLGCLHYPASSDGLLIAHNTTTPFQIPYTSSCHFTPCSVPTDSAVKYCTENHSNFYVWFNLELASTGLVPNKLASSLLYL